MFIVGQPAIWAQLLLTLFVPSSARPPIDSTPGLVDKPLIGLLQGEPWPPEIPVSQASLLYPIPGTPITLNFTDFGPSIPVVRALSTMYDARRQVQSHLASGPTHTINGSFSYSTHSKSPTSQICSIVVQADHSHSLSWSQLDTTLAGLTQFSSGASSDHQFHYQALAFSITTSPSSARIGTGLLSWLPTLNSPPTAPSKKRATPNPTSQLLSKSPLLLSPPTNLTTHPSFPVPGTTITLIFIWLGPPISPATINNALHGAFTEINPHLTALNQPVPDNIFIYSEFAPGKSKMETVLQIYGDSGGMALTWATVDTVLTGLYRFVNGLGTVHGREYYRCLEFQVWEGMGHGGGGGVMIGYGNLLEVY